MGFSHQRRCSSRLELLTEFELSNSGLKLDSRLANLVSDGEVRDQLCLRAWRHGLRADSSILRYHCVCCCQRRLA